MPNVLIVEDDVMIADLIEDCLIRAGYEICGIARTVTEAVALCRLDHPDLATIDIRLADGGLGTEIVARLRGCPRVGILYASGNIHQIIDTAEGDACIAKPYHTQDLLRALRIVEQIVSNGVAAPPFPLGFHLLDANHLSPREPVHG
jgi:two-component system, response regulator PdtaR